VEQEGIICSECNTLNEPGWSFCQQCGKRLNQPAAAAPPPPPPQPFSPADLRTVPEQHAVDPDFVQALKTNPEPQPAERGLKTVVAQPTSFEPPPYSPPPRRTPLEEQPTLETTPKHPLPSPPPPVASHPQPIETESSELRTVETPAQPKETAPTPPLPPQPQPQRPAPSAHSAPKPSTPAAASSPDETMINQGSTSGVLCTQCGQNNTLGSAFCASCGAPITFGGKTMVISSQPAAEVVKGRLHLVMEGGQPGEVYDLDNETIIGRSSGEITFPHDGFMSGRHAKIEKRGGSFILSDEGSRNGTFIKTKGEVELKSGDMILVGKQLFRFESESGK